MRNNGLCISSQNHTKPIHESTQDLRLAMQDIIPSHLELLIHLFREKGEITFQNIRLLGLSHLKLVHIKKVEITFQKY